MTLLLWLAAAGILLAEDERPARPTIERLGLFKNGLVVVEASFPVEAAGSHLWAELPRVLHGSFWIESDARVVVRTATREVGVEDAPAFPGAAPQQELAGSEVTLQLKAEEGGERIRGFLVPPAAPSPSPASASFLSSHGRVPAAPPAPMATGDFLVLDVANGRRSYIDRSSVLKIERLPGREGRRTTSQPVMVFEIDEVPEGGGRVNIGYLTRGMAWLPSWRLDTSDPDELELRLNALVVNEMGDVEDAEIELISGFPNVGFGHVDTPLAGGIGLEAYFQQVIRGPAAGGGGILSNALTQTVAYHPGAAALPEMAEEGASGEDLHFLPLGRRTLAAGETLSLEVARREVGYRRVVEWAVADGRDAHGRSQGLPPGSDEAWDALRFRNPLEFPMTSAPAMVVEDGRFRGQGASSWVNPGQATCLRVNKALSVQTLASEREIEEGREALRISGRDYHRITVEGRLKARNHRATAVNLALSCDFSGEWVAADGDPEISLRTENLAGVNPRRRLEWSLDLAAGEERELLYRYRVLVAR